MRAWFAIGILALCTTAAWGLTLTPAPGFGDVKKTAVFIGIVEVVQVPVEPAAGFRGDKLPVVTVKVVESWKGAAKGTACGYLWDGSFRWEAVTSYNSAMVPPDPAKEPILLPPKGQRLVVFAEARKDGVWRDIYGWRRRPIVQNLPPGSLDEAPLRWWGYDNRCLRVAPLEEIGQTANFYARKKFIYKSEPDDPRTRGCLQWTSVSAKGDYWLLTASTAVKMTVNAIEANPSWPVRYIVQKGDALAGIAQRFYDDESRWKDIAKGNKLRDPARIRVGMVLVIPPVRDTGRGR